MAIDEEPVAPVAPGDPAAIPARKRHVTRGILILMVLTVAGVVAPFIASIFASHSGGGIGTQAQFLITITNDTGATLNAQKCGSGCLPDVAKASIPPGGSVQLSVASGGAVTRYYLLDASGRLVGCLPLRFTRQVTGFALAASRAESCPGNPITAPWRHAGRRA